MKKMILAAMLLAACTLSAQEEKAYEYISPIGVQLMQFNLNDMQAAAPNDAAYEAELTSLEKSLKQEEKALEQEAKSLKQERALYDKLMDLFKSRKAQTENLKKDMQKQIEKYNDFQKGIDKCQDIIKKIDNTSCDAIRGQSEYLHGLEKRCKREKEHCQEVQDDMNRNAGDELNKVYAQLNSMLIEITDKETRLKNITAQNKTNIEIVKTAKKTLQGK